MGYICLKDSLHCKKKANIIIIIIMLVYYAMTNRNAVHIESSNNTSNNVQITQKMSTGLLKQHTCYEITIIIKC